MRVISEERLKQIAHETQNSVDTNLLVLSLLNSIISECKEPNSWIPLEEFLKSWFEGWCWVNAAHDVIISYFETGVFYSNDLGSAEEIYQPELNITHVQPIHKPEPPR